MLMEAPTIIPTLTVREAAAHLGVSRKTVYLWTKGKNPKIHATKDVCNQVRIPYHEVIRILEERRGLRLLEEEGESMS
jgi:excisionase family DNA binding protein